MIVIFFWLSSCSSLGGRWKTFTAKDGLANDKTFTIIEDPDGVLWFGTLGGGISSFDGHSWQSYFTGKENRTSDNCNQIFSLAIGGENEIWYGTNGCFAGVIQFESNRSDYNIQRYYIDAGSFVFSILDDHEGNIWFGTLMIEIPGETPYQSEGGLARYDGNTWSTYLEEHSINSIIKAQDGTLWFGTGLGGVFQFDGSIWVNYTTKDGLISNQIMDIASEPDGALWFGGVGGISRYDGQNWVSYNSTDGLASNHVTSIAIDADGALWVGTLGQGVSCFRENEWINYSVDDGLGSNRVEDLLVASDGTIWVATDAGVSQFR